MIVMNDYRHLYKDMLSCGFISELRKIYDIRGKIQYEISISSMGHISYYTVRADAGIIHTGAESVGPITGCFR